MSEMLILIGECLLVVFTAATTAVRAAAAPSVISGCNGFKPPPPYVSQRKFRSLPAPASDGE